MKIIGHTHDGYLIELKQREFAHLTGRGSEYDLSDRMVPVGTVIDIFAGWKRLQELFQAKGESSRIAQKLRGLASILDDPIPILDSGVTDRQPTTPRAGE